MKKLLFLLFLFVAAKTFAQQTFSITDSMPVLYNGLKAGYIIEDETEKSVGKKGDFSRFRIQFYVTNTSSEAKILYRNARNYGSSQSVSKSIALFKCLNATGARFTNKTASMDLDPCKMDALVEDKDCNTGKTVQNVRVVDVGYWIRPGQTITRNYLMIVPLNDRPRMTITFYPDINTQSGSMMSSSNTQQVQNLARIRNIGSNGYLLAQYGVLACSLSDNNSMSAQWEIIQVSGSNNFQIRNRQGNTYLSTDNSSLLSTNGQSANALWRIEESSLQNAFYIRNATTNAKLIFQNGQLSTTISYVADAAAQWVIENQ